MELEKAISAVQYALEMEKEGVRFYGEKQMKQLLLL